MPDNTRALLHAYRPGEVELIIPAGLQEARFELRSLRALVESVPDSLTFAQQGGEITFEPSRNPTAAPWHNAVGALIAHYFTEPLAELLPAGTWHLAVLQLDLAEIAARYNGEVVLLASLHPDQPRLM